jgi:hypothetical protein
MMPKMSGFSVVIAATIFADWRSNSVSLSAPRQSVVAPPTPFVQPLKVLK